MGDLFQESFQFVRMNLEDREELPSLFIEHKFDTVCNLAAQAGVNKFVGWFKNYTTITK
jgi:UDP-glucuronate 4-epimerase